MKSYLKTIQVTDQWAWALSHLLEDVCILVATIEVMVKLENVGLRPFHIDFNIGVTWMES